MTTSLTPFTSTLRAVRDTRPLIHCITNYVTVNDVANALLAIGASPVMADEHADAIDIAGLATGMVINIGTLNSRTIPAMFAAGAIARDLGHPIVLDPVGAGASALRTQTAVDLCEQLHPAVIRGNMSEVKALVGASASTHGVDVNAVDAVSEDTLDQAVDFARTVAETYDTIVAVTGAIDIVSNGEIAFVLRAGRAEMGLITGTGCMLSAITAAFVASNPDDLVTATAGAALAMGLAGETGWEQAAGRGTGSYRVAIIDALSTMVDFSGQPVIEIRK